jgi:hypothetical protein
MDKSKQLRQNKEKMWGYDGLTTTFIPHTAIDLHRFNLKDFTSLRIIKKLSS